MVTRVVRSQVPAPRTSFARGITLSFFEDFEFDDAPQTEEQRPARERTGGRRGAGGDGPSTGPSIQRLLPLIGLAVLVLVLGYWFLGCSGGSSGGAERTYVRDVNTLLASSKTAGKALDDSFYNSDLQPEQIVAQVAAAGDSARRNVATAQGLKPPGKLKPFQPSLVQALQYRQQAAADLAGALDVALKSQTSPLPMSFKTGVAKAYDTVIASDAILAQSFLTPSQRALNDAKIKDAQLNTDSVWALTPLLASADDSGDLISAMKGEAACTGAKGTSIDGATVNGQTLSTGTTNAIKASFSKFTFKITITNSGACLLRNVRATATIPGVAPTKAVTVPRLAAGQSKDVTITLVATNMTGTQTAVLNVDKQPGETRLDNNRYSYKIANKL